MGNAGNAECSSDGTQWTLCATPFRIDASREGTTTLSVRAVSPAGERGPVRRHLDVDLTPPQTIIRKGAAAPRRREPHGARELRHRRWRAASPRTRRPPSPSSASHKGRGAPARRSYRGRGKALGRQTLRSCARGRCRRQHRSAWREGALQVTTAPLVSDAAAARVGAPRRHRPSGSARPEDRVRDRPARPLGHPTRARPPRAAPQDRGLAGAIMGIARDHVGDALVDHRPREPRDGAAELAGQRRRGDLSERAGRDEGHEQLRVSDGTRRSAQDGRPGSCGRDSAARDELLEAWDVGGERRFQQQQSLAPRCRSVSCSSSRSIARAIATSAPAGSAAGSARRRGVRATPGRRRGRPHPCWPGSRGRRAACTGPSPRRQRAAPSEIEGRLLVGRAVVDAGQKVTVQVDHDPDATDPAGAPRSVAALEVEVGVEPRRSSRRTGRWSGEATGSRITANGLNPAPRAGDR